MVRRFDHSFVALGALALAVSSCGPVSRRDLSSIPQRRISYDDMCHLQTYFDQRPETLRQPWRAVDEQSTETSRREPDERGRMQVLMIGDGNYLLSDGLARGRLASLLRDEYAGLPEDFNASAGSEPVRIHASWWSSGLARRLRPDQNVTITAGGHTVEVPFNPCLGEFLFGGPLYVMRRQFLDDEATRARGQIPQQRNSSVDGGFVGASVTPGNVAPAAPAGTPPPAPAPPAAPPPAAPPAPAPAAPPASAQGVAPTPYH